jgi:hypothetical protein
VCHKPWPATEQPDGCGNQAKGKYDLPAIAKCKPLIVLRRLWVHYLDFGAAQFDYDPGNAHENEGKQWYR